ncbi:putative undecaprenyl pyrophosphate synthase [Termitomyces sp. T112]|nr:putative undecaprenyl pyrophosphate synthase [Termitomyces sp. T112]
MASLVAILFLRALHYFYSLIILCYSFCSRSSPSFPRPSCCHRIPKHLALLLVSGTAQDNSDLRAALVRTVVDAVSWCRASGIQQLTVYEEHGVLLKLSKNICDSLPTESEEALNDSDIEYPLTPPPSDYSESRPISPQNPQADSHVRTIRILTTKHNSPPQTGAIKRKELVVNHASQNQLTLYLMSRRSSKPAIASVAQAFVLCNKQKQRTNAKHIKTDAFLLSVNELESSLESDHTLSSPDVMIVHTLIPQQDSSSPLELHGYPPWQIRLTEIYHTRPDCSRYRPIITGHSSTPKCMSLSEDSFNQALDEYTAAEMRFGK